MIRSLYFSLFFLFIAGCSFQTQPNLWQQKSYSNFEAYKKDFLSNQDDLAQSDLERAITQAKRSADLKTLASIHLGKCALDIAVGIESKCDKYLDLKDLIHCPYLENYYNFIQKDFTHTSTTLIDPTYKEFLEALHNKDIDQANKAIIKITVPSSKLLAITLFQNDVSKEAIQSGIDLLSYYGYKKGVVYLLEMYAKKTDDPKEREQIKEKIKILTE